MNNKTKFIVAVLAAVCCSCWLLNVCTANGGQENWRLGMQAYSFNRFTFYEAVDKTRALGMRYIEAYPGQRLRSSRNRALSW